MDKHELILGIDAGTTESGYVLISNAPEVEQVRLFRYGIAKNIEIRDLIIVCKEAGEIDTIAIEDIRSYGMPIGKSTLETVKWMGRFKEVAYCMDIPFHEIPKKGVDGINIAICGTNNAKDPNIRKALIEQFSTTWQHAIGKKSDNTCGPLYGLKSHMFAALAVAMTYRMRTIINQNNHEKTRTEESEPRQKQMAFR